MGKNLKIFLIAFLLSLPFWWGVNLFQKNLEDYFTAQLSQPLQEIEFIKIPQKPAKPELQIEAKAAISLQINPDGSQKILFEKETEKPLPIASLTKIMTALIVLEDPENYNFSKIITVSSRAANQEDVPEYGNLKAGERKSVEELLKLMFFFSSNDAAFALAEEIEVENFIGRMNKRAMELGLENTNFSNPTGLDPENSIWNEENKDLFNYSTGRDLAKLTKHILEEFPVILEYSNQENQFSLLANQKIFGIKTGYTDEAGGCMVLIFHDGKKSFINIILGTKSKKERYTEMQKLIDWLNN